MKKGLIILLVAAALGACAGGEERRERAAAIDDFIEVNELQNTNSISLRFKEIYRHEMLGERHALVSTAGGDYLVTFFTRCIDYDGRTPPPDRRRNANMLAAGEDSIRGCRIDRIYPVDAGQRDEIRELGTAPGS